MDLKQGDLENIILNALWDLEAEGNGKIFVGDVQDKIKSVNKKWAYTTVKTVLDRLVDKEIALREKDGKKYLYKSMVNRDSAGVMALQKVLRQYFKNDVHELLTCLNKMENAPVNVQDAQPGLPTPLEVERQTAQNQLQDMQKSLTQKP